MLSNLVKKPLASGEYGIQNYADLLALAGSHLYQTIEPVVNGNSQRHPLLEEYTNITIEAPKKEEVRGTM